MSEIQNNNKLATVSYLSKVLTPIVTLIKSVQTSVMNIFSLPKGGSAGQVLVKSTEIDGEVEWADAPTQIEENLKAYVDEQLESVDVSGTIDDGEI